MVYKINLIQVAKQHRLAAESSKKSQPHQRKTVHGISSTKVTEGDGLLMILQLQILKYTI